MSAGYMTWDWLETSGKMAKRKRQSEALTPHSHVDFWGSTQNHWSIMTKSAPERASDILKISKVALIEVVRLLLAHLSRLDKAWHFP